MNDSLLLSPRMVFKVKRIVIMRGFRLTGSDRTVQLGFKNHDRHRHSLNPGLNTIASANIASLNIKQSMFTTRWLTMRKISFFFGSICEPYEKN